MAQLRYLDMERGLEHEPQMRVWDQDADEYRTGHLQMVDCEVYIGRLAKSVVKDCFGDVQSTESYVESVLWKRVPNLLIYWLHQTIRRCLRELFQRDINVAGMKAEESSDWFLQSLCKESRQIGVEEINRITGSRNRRSWNKHARQACITLFASDPHIVSELGRLSDKEFDVVFRSGYKHLDSPVGDRGYPLCPWRNNVHDPTGMCTCLPGSLCARRIPSRGRCACWISTKVPDLFTHPAADPFPDCQTDVRLQDVHQMEDVQGSCVGNLFSPCGKAGLRNWWR
jgi:hypothetical protein